MGETASQSPVAAGPQARSKMVASSIVNQERLPMLDVVFDRLVRLLTSGLRQFTSANSRVHLADARAMRFGEILEEVPSPSLVAVVNARQWDNKFLLAADGNLIYSVVDVLLGGRQGPRPEVPGRPFTPIERRLTERLFKLVLQTLQEAFLPIAVVDFQFERLESNPQFAAISRSTNATIRARAQIEVEHRSGQLDLVLPYATLEPVRGLLLQMFMGERFGRDQIWESHLKAEIRRSQLRLTAILHEELIMLGQVLNWRPGQTLNLSATTETPARLVCGSTQLFTGELGQKHGNIAVKLTSNLQTEEDVVNGLASD